MGSECLEIILDQRQPRTLQNSLIFALCHADLQLPRTHVPFFILISLKVAPGGLIWILEHLQHLTPVHLGWKSSLRPQCLPRLRVQCCMV